MQLNTPITDELTRLTDFQKKALKKLKLETVQDILWHFPSRYEELGEHKILADVSEGEKASFSGKIKNLKLEKTWKTKMNIARAILDDGTEKISLTWFHQPFVAKILKEGDFVTVSGKVQRNKNGLYLANPHYEKSYENNLTKNKFIAIYPETRGLSSQWFRFSIQKILKKILTNTSNPIEDIVPKEILKKYNLPTLKNSLQYIHTPKELKDAEAARKRFAFQEIFFLQLTRLLKREKQKKQESFDINIDKKELDKFLKKFPFEMTKAQKKALDSILKDLEKGEPMARFMEGDVGSGKTAVAATAIFLVAKNKYQTAYMCPTEVLASQIFDSFLSYFKGTNIKVGLLTSSGCKKFPSKTNPNLATQISKARFLKWVGEGEIDVIVGTHSLIQDSVKFSLKNKKVYLDKKLAFVVIDEQHRFGTNQRAALINKKNETNREIIPHFLSMSATPIPRTLALTVYGDLDITLLDEMPPGRKKIITEIVPPTSRSKAYEKIREEIEKGRQAYVICPRIEKPDENKKENLLTLNMRAVKEEHQKLSEEIFPEYRTEMLHGKMVSKEKEKIMKEFEKGKINILIATSVIEVGVNVPNATTIIIEGAERFGLAQLHQLRGRVLRSNHQPYCFVFTESKTQKTLERLKAIKTAKNGFELAEYDLQLRGAGELSGKKQWGISDVGMEAIKNIKMVEAARNETQKILEKDIELNKYPLLKNKVEQENQNIHFE
ncbi:MAG: ATP-dependent DNA helicase RecG [Candidatus Marinimicrobia bacterium]|nr:ATP-dependent DNA helicase RecG [Candidatus Neomarinimicrobiota bacterium]